MPGGRSGSSSSLGSASAAVTVGAGTGRPVLVTSLCDSGADPITRVAFSTLALRPAEDLGVKSQANAKIMATKLTSKAVLVALFIGYAPENVMGGCSPGLLAIADDDGRVDVCVRSVSTRFERRWSAHVDLQGDQLRPFD